MDSCSSVLRLNSASTSGIEQKKETKASMNDVTKNLPKYAVSIRDLTKVYKPEKKGLDLVKALDSVSLSIPRGGIYGLLGPNGAGKSTLINILGGIVRKTSGVATIWDRDIDKDSRNSRAAIGIVPQEINIDPFFAPEVLLNIQAGLFGVPRSERRTEQILKSVHLWDKRTTYVRALSGGMKRRLLIAKAMVHQPPILVLDEPTAGVDVELRQHLWELIGELNRGGVTIILTTHYLEEAQQLCDRIAIIHHGKVVVEDKKDLMLQKLDSKTLVVTVERPWPEAVRELVSYPVELSKDVIGRDVLTINYAPSKIRTGEVIDAIRAHKVGLADISTVETDLQTLFLQLTK